MLRRTLIAFTAAAALGCLPMATTALAAHAHDGGKSGHVAGHGGGGHYARASGGHYARGGGGYYGGGYYGGPIYDSCAGYGYGSAYSYGGCRGYGVPIVGQVINGVLGGYGPY